MDLVLQLSPAAAGVGHGTLRRASDPADRAAAFHGVLELVAVLERLLDEDGHRRGGTTSSVADGRDEGLARGSPIRRASTIVATTMTTEEQP